MGETSTWLQARHLGSLAAFPSGNCPVNGCASRLQEQVRVLGRRLGPGLALSFQPGTQGCRAGPASCSDCMGESRSPCPNFRKAVRKSQCGCL